MDYLNKRLSNAEALGIANDLLKAFNILYNAIEMRVASSVQGKHQTIRKVFCNLKSIEPIRIEEQIINYDNSNKYHLDNVYELYWKNRRFVATIYVSPEECGYYSVLPNYCELDYYLCIIEEKNPLGYMKNQMCFGFDFEKKVFLELFDIDYRSSYDGIIYSAEDSVESRLQGTIII